MLIQDFLDCFTEVYIGQQIDEVAFNVLLGKPETLEQTDIMGSLLQFETGGKARARPVLSRLGLSMLDDPRGRTDGLAASAAMGDLRWTGFASALEVWPQMPDVAGELVE